MKFSISNLAWQKKEEENVLNLVRKKIKLLEFAPSLILKNLNSKKEILKTKKYWKKKAFHSIPCNQFYMTQKIVTYLAVKNK